MQRQNLYIIVKKSVHKILGFLEFTKQIHVIQHKNKRKNNDHHDRKKKTHKASPILYLKRKKGKEKFCCLISNSYTFFCLTRKYSTMLNGKYNKHLIFFCF